jgi:hypothetical protein
MNAVTIRGEIELGEMPFYFEAKIIPGYDGKYSGRPEDCFPGMADEIESIELSYRYTKNGAERYAKMPDEMVDDLKARNAYTGFIDAIFEAFEKWKKLRSDESRYVSMKFSK